MSKEAKKTIAFISIGAVIFIGAIFLTYQKPVHLPEEYKAKFQTAIERTESIIRLAEQVRNLVLNGEETNIEEMEKLKDEIQEKSLGLAQEIGSLTRELNNLEASVRQTAFDVLVLGAVFLSETTEYLEALEAFIGRPEERDEILSFLNGQLPRVERSGRNFLDSVR